VLALASGQKPGQKKPGPGQAIEHGLGWPRAWPEYFESQSQRLRPWPESALVQPYISFNWKFKFGFQ